MKALDDCTMAHLEMVLDDACRSLPHGGDHAIRKKVARRLLCGARKGIMTVDSLAIIARDALDQATKRSEAGRPH
jgi:hypothetical protein